MQFLCHVDDTEVSKDNTAVESVFVPEDCDTSSESAASDTSSSASDDGESSSNPKNKKSKKHGK